MRHLAIGDIHGCYDALITLADFVPFRPDDVLVTLGDYVDRGPDSFKVIEWMLDWQRKGQLVPLRGNHEVMMLNARGGNEEWLDNWLNVGGYEALESYAHLGEEAELENVPESHWNFLENDCRGWYETDTHIFVHANLCPDIPLEDQPDYMLYWESFHNPIPHESGKVMVCGHTAQKSGEPLNKGFGVCIDTRCYRNGWLTCLDVGTDQFWQANQEGETRAGLLDDPDEWLE